MAGLKIQAIFDLCSQCWIHFQLSGSSANDQQASSLILEHLQAGDLVIRDLGYAVLKVWRQIIDQDAYFPSRWRNDLGLFDAQTNQPLDLLALVQQHPQLRSLEVLVGAQQRLPLRLVALRLRLKPGLSFLGPSGRIPTLRRQLLSVSLNQSFFNSLLGSQLLFDSAIKPAQVLTKGRGRI